jgi:2-desacetyl-2-hydroxyethyl bacteriochlorophyllide A dehydrogenase
MAEVMKAVRLHALGDLRLDEVAVPEPGAFEALVRVHRCGICGTDLHIVRGDFPAPNLPLVLGHEFSGTVVSLGVGVREPPVGARVVVDINMACGQCYFCRRGQKLFCPKVLQLGVHAAGALAEYVVVPAANVHVVPAGLSLDTAAYVEPLACAVHGQDRVSLMSGDSVLILGAGPMGLAHVALSRLAGAARIMVSEPEPARRALAAKLGADMVLDPTATDIGAGVREATRGVGPDVVIEAVGTIATYEAAFGLVRRGGTVLAYGAAPAGAKMSLSPFDIYSKELTVVGSYAGSYDTWTRAIELLAAGRFDPSLIVDSVRPLAEAVDAVYELESKKELVKVEIQVEA